MIHVYFIQKIIFSPLVVPFIFTFTRITTQTSKKFAEGGGGQDFLVNLTFKLSNLVPEKDLKTA